MLNHRLAWHYQMRRHRTRLWVYVKDTATAMLEKGLATSVLTWVRVVTTSSNPAMTVIAAIGIFVWGVWS